MRATATAELTESACLHGASLAVSFAGRDGLTSQTLQQPDCGRSYRTGEYLTVYVASNDPTDPGSTENWVLRPDAHNPADFIGPNGLPGFVGTIGFIALVAGAVVAVRARRRRLT